MSRSRIIITALLTAALLGLGVPLALILIRRAQSPQVVEGLAPTTVPDVRRFQLTDQQGQPFGTTQLHGRVALIYFGYTFCPDICPTELGYIARVMHGLGADADQVAPVFITLDPERDSQQALADYVQLFDKRLIGLRGTPAEVDAVATAYGVMHQRTQVVTKQAGYYLIDHTSTIFVLDRDGRIADTLDSDTAIPVAVARLRRLLK